MARLRATCVRRRIGGKGPHERIRALGGVAPTRWYRLEEAIIHDIETGANSYYVEVKGKPVDVVVAVHLGRKYIKTVPDAYLPSVLLDLPECP